jgi:virulence-associated protein VagC
MIGAPDQHRISVDVTTLREYTEARFSETGKQGRQMEKPIPLEITERGILIPCEALDELDEDELEAVREGDRIVIRPRTGSADERERVGQVLRAAGLLYEPGWEHPSPVSEEERARLAQKLGAGGPLSDMILADRQDRV